MRLARRRLAFLEALVGALEEFLLRALEQLPADLGELRAERFLGGDDFGEPDLERPLALLLRGAGGGMARGEVVMLGAQRVERAA